MKNISKKVSLFVSALLLVVPLTHAAKFFIHDGDRVVFLGDSITEQRLYTTYIEAYTLTRFPDWKLFFRNAGWSGDTSWLRNRYHCDEATLFAAEPAEQQKMVETAVAFGLDRDVLPLKPTVVTIDFGMNDHEYQAFRPDIFRAYVRSETELARVLQQHGVRVALVTPQPIEEHRPDPDRDVRNESLKKFSDGLKDVAARTGALFVDQWDPYMRILMEARASNPEAFVGEGNAVHPGPAGHTLMAWAILRGLDAPALVSRASIDAATGKVLDSDQCRITHVQTGRGSLRFDRLDDALPMPIDGRARSALKRAPVLKDLDEYVLQVTGLPDGTYQLTIDGKPSETLTSQALAKGCNLAVVPGPIVDQSQEVLQLVFKKNNVYFQRWRDVQLHRFPDWVPMTSALVAARAAELARLDRQIAKMEAEIDAARRPKPHHFELKAVAE